MATGSANASSTSQRFRFADGVGEIGFINPVSEPFCATCDRIRLTADGQLRSCLFATDESDMRGPMRAGASDEQLAEVVQRCVAAKGAGHMIGQVQFVRPRRSMSQIGG